MLTRKDYKVLARTMGDGLAIALLAGGESAREEFYNEAYLDLALYLMADNPRFDSVRFSYAAAEAERDFLKAARECGREVPDA